MFSPDVRQRNFHRSICPTAQRFNEMFGVRCGKFSAARRKAVRAVGGACGANPIPVLVPCHRVLAANKKLGGFSGGLNWKRKLLTREEIGRASCRERQ